MNNYCLILFVLIQSRIHTEPFQRLRVSNFESFSRYIDDFLHLNYSHFNESVYLIYYYIPVTFELMIPPKEEVLLHILNFNSILAQIENSTMKPMINVKISSNTPLALLYDIYI